MGNVVVLKNYQLTKEAGQHHRIVCMTGERRGEVYYIRSKRVLLGRSKDADIPIYDAQSSREHAELSKVGPTYIITDLKSNNGVVVNGQKIKQTRLKSRDRIIIGKTVYKYEIINIREEKLSVINPGEDQTGAPEIKEEGKKKSKAIVVLVAIAAAMFFLFEEEGTDTNKPKKKQLIRSNGQTREIKKVKESKQEKEVKKRLDTIMQKGIRELREGNYYRAISEFSLALIIDPQNSRGLAYKRKAKDLQDKEISSYFDQASRDIENYNNYQAIKNYCQVIKILEDFPEDDRRKSAEESLAELADREGGNESAINCN